MSFFIRLLLAHLLGDFVLQFNPWIRDKEKHKWKSPFLYLHAGIHFLLILLVTWDIGLWKTALLISVSHLIIDGIKLSIVQKTTKTQWPFFIDQLLHIFILVGVAFAGRWPGLVKVVTDTLNWKILTAYVFLTFPAGIVMEKLLARWAFEEKENASLPKAGKIIGIIERLLVLTFILLDHWEAIGFLITAKSVFRFNDLKISNRKLTEYILIGTLLSFGLAILTGILLL